MMSYTIMEFNSESNKWKTIGYADANNSTDAKKEFVDKNNWQADNPKIILFAKPPVCR